MENFRQRLNKVVKQTRNNQASSSPDHNRFIAPSGITAASTEATMFAPGTMTETDGTEIDGEAAEEAPGQNEVVESAKNRYLSEIEIFADLSRGEIDHLAKTTTMFTTEKGKVFYFPEEAGEVVFLLKKGKVQLYRLSSEGRKLTIATLGRGAIFGEMSFLGQGMYNTFAEAIEDCLICIMSRQEMAQLLISKPQIALRILEVMGRRLQNAETQLEEVAFKKVPERLALVLLRLAGVERGAAVASTSGEGIMSGGPLTVSGLTHQDLGEMIATHRETVSFTLNDFKARALVDLAPKSITLLDIEGLRSLCS